jgi:hypothetical protein
MAESAEVQGPPTQAQSSAQQRKADNEARGAYKGGTPTSKVHYRIDSSTFAILMLFAGTFDFFGLSDIVVPGAGTVIDVIAQFMIGLIFVVNGVSIIERRFLIRYVLFTVIEFIPFLSMFPALMAEVYMLSALTWIADKALATATKATSKVVGQRYAGAMVGLAYGRAITGQAPVPPLLERKAAQGARDLRPLDDTWRGNIANFGKNVAAMKDQTNFLGAAMKNDAVGQFGRMPESKIPPSERGGGATYVDGMRVQSVKPQATETTSPAASEDGVKAPTGASVDGVRPETREAPPESTPQEETSATPPSSSQSVDGVRPGNALPANDNVPLTRRQVLQGVVASAVTAAARSRLLKAVSGAALALKPVQANAAPQENWLPNSEQIRTEGVERLRNAAITNQNEHAAIFLKKGTTGQWIDFGQVGDKTHGVLPIEDLKKSLEDPLVSAEIMHTHSLQGILREKHPLSSDTTTFEIGPGSALPSMPPSFQDVISLAQLKESLGTKANRLTGIIADPAGTWQYNTDQRHPFIQKMLAVIKESTNLGTRNIPDSVREEIRTTLERQGYTPDADPRLAFQNLMDNIKNLSPQTQQTLRTLTAPLERIASDSRGKAMLESELNFANHDYNEESERRRVIEIFKKAGVSLTYSVHQKTTTKSSTP